MTANVRFAKSFAAVLVLATAGLAPRAHAELPPPTPAQVEAAVFGMGEARYARLAADKCGALTSAPGPAFAAASKAWFDRNPFGMAVFVTLHHEARLAHPGDDAAVDRAHAERVEAIKAEAARRVAVDLAGDPPAVAACERVLARLQDPAHDLGNSKHAAELR